MVWYGAYENDSDLRYSEVPLKGKNKKKLVKILGVINTGRPLQVIFLAGGRDPCNPCGVDAMHRRHPSRVHVRIVPWTDRRWSMSRHTIVSFRCASSCSQLQMCVWRLCIETAASIASSCSQSIVSLPSS